jgi:hypothetical protein
MPNLFHISETPNIREFKPRPVQNNAYQIKDDVVWAIAGEHLPNYYLPRDCPRVTFFVSEETTPADQAKFFGHTYATKIIAVETAWVQRILSQKLFRYEFNPSGFELIDQTAGYYVSRNCVFSLNEVQIDNILGELLSTGVELHFMPLLWKLREAVIHSSLGFSIIRMQNAAPPPEGLEAFYPLP